MDKIKICKRCKNLCNISMFKLSKKTGKPLNPCSECIKEIKKNEREKNKKRNNITKAKWAARNQESVKESKRKWKQNNIGKVKADKAKRKKYVKLATPNWLTETHLDAIDFYYMMADLRSSTSGIKYDVDHVIPLRGKDVCGLNVPWNLEVIKKDLNLKKGNKLLPHRIRG